MYESNPIDEECVRAEKREVPLEFTDHLRNDVVAGAEKICRENAIGAGWSHFVKIAVAGSVVFIPGMM